MIRHLIAPAAQRDAIVYLAQAATTGPPWLAIALAAIATLSAIGVALAPALVERVKRGRTPAATPSATTQSSADGSVDLVREALTDVRRERDEAQDEAKELTRELAAANRAIAERDVSIAKRDARIEALETLLARLGGGKT